MTSIFVIYDTTDDSVWKKAYSSLKAALVAVQERLDEVNKEIMASGNYDKDAWEEYGPSAQMNPAYDRKDGTFVADINDGDVMIYIKQVKLMD